MDAATSKHILKRMSRNYLRISKEKQEKKRLLKSLELQETRFSV
jgi:hypothetical protein